MRDPRHTTSPKTPARIGSSVLLEHPANDSLIVWSNGGGTQSATIAALIDAGELPKPHISCIVDTGYETETTWQYYEGTVKPAMEKLGVKCYRIEASKYRTVGLHGKNGDLLLPVFTRQSGALSKMPTFCSTEWKWRVLKRWLREQGVNKCELWMGMSWDELDRMKDSDCQWITKTYPLIETRRMRRWECAPYVINHGWPNPPRSRCYICPNQQPAEWQELPGKEKLAAIKLDSVLRTQDPDVYLHMSGKPLGEAINEKTNDNQPQLFGTCDGGHCFV